MQHTLFDISLWDNVDERAVERLRTVQQLGTLSCYFGGERRTAAVGGFSYLMAIMGGQQQCLVASLVVRRHRVLDSHYLGMGDCHQRLPVGVRHHGYTGR